MLTLPANWINAMGRTGAAPIFLVEIDNGTTTWKATSGKSDVLTYPEAVIDIEDSPPSLDPVAHEVRVGSITVTLEDGWLRPIYVNNRLHRKKISVSVGERSLAEVDFVPIFTDGIIDTIAPAKGGAVEIESLSTAGLLLEKTIGPGAFTPKHPLDQITSILSLIDVPSAMINSSAFDPSTAGYTAFSHFSAARVGMTAYQEPAKAIDAVNELARMLPGYVAVRENGLIDFLPFDASTAASASWGKDDYTDFVQDDGTAALLNRASISIEQYHTQSGGGRPIAGAIKNDLTSQTNFAYPGQTSGIKETHQHFPWSSHAMYLAANVTDVATSWTCSLAIGAIAGLVDLVAGQDAHEQLSGSRPAYFRIDSEIVKVTAVALVSKLMAHYVDPADGSNDVYSYPATVTLTVARAQYGTSAAAHNSHVSQNVQNPLIDVTAPLARCDAIVDRFGSCAPRISCTTGLDQIGLQIGDLVELTDDRFLFFGVDGILPASGKWEIVEKKINGRKIRWRLVRATTAEAASTSRPPTFFDPQRPSSPLVLPEAILSVIRNSTSGGFAITQTAGRAGSIAAGTAGNSDRAFVLLEAIANTFTASKDTYVYADVWNRGIRFVETANGAGTPTLPQGCALLGKVVTDATTITSIDTTIAHTTALDGSRLLDGTVNTTQITDDAITTAKINAQAVTEAKIAEHSVTPVAAKPRAFSAVLAATDSVTKEVWTKIAYTTAAQWNLVHGAETGYDHSSAVAYVIPNAGGDDLFYHFRASCEVSNVATTGYAQLRLRYDNSTTIVMGPKFYNGTGSAQTMIASLSADVGFQNVSATHNITVELWVSDGSSIQIQSTTQTFFEGRQFYQQA